jgi:hypothetical protein
VAQYWIVDPGAHLVEVWRPRDRFPTTEDARLTWHPRGAAEPLVIELTQLFRPV